MTYTDTELHALGFTRQSKTMWRKGDVVYQNGKFYYKGVECEQRTDIIFAFSKDDEFVFINGYGVYKRQDLTPQLNGGTVVKTPHKDINDLHIDPHEAEEGKEK